MSAKTTMRRFQFHRDEDVHGVSGTGVVAEGVEFANGLCVLSWLSQLGCTTTTFGCRRAMEEELHGHEERTRIVWIEENEGVAVQAARVGASILAADNSVELPRYVRDALGITPGSYVYFVRRDDGFRILSELAMDEALGVVR